MREGNNDQTSGASAATDRVGKTAREMVDAGLLDDLLGQVDEGSLQLTGEGGFLPEMIKTVLERGLKAELTNHLGYQKGRRADSPNYATGRTRKRSLPRSATSC